MVPALTQIPVIETERLRLRGHRVADFKDCAAMWADPIVTQYIGGRPFTAEEVWARLLRYAGHWTWLGFGYWLIEDRETGHFVGELGFADFKRALDPPLNATMPELGWALAATAHGRGYATEAVRAAITWGDTHLGATATMCLIDPANQPSIRVAQKCGYHPAGDRQYKGHTVQLFTRSAQGA